MNYPLKCELCGVNRYRDFGPATKTTVDCHSECLEKSKQMITNDRWKRLTVNDDWRYRMQQLDKVDADIGDDTEQLSAKDTIVSILENLPFITKRELRKRLNTRLGREYDPSNFK